MSKKGKNQEIVVKVTKEQYEKQIAEGLNDDEVLKPGVHKFIRGGFQKRHLDFNFQKSKTRINICIDSDVLQHFRKRAETSNAAPYQTQINAELRKIMEKDLETATSETLETAKILLENEEFLKALAEKLKERDLQTA